MYWCALIRICFAQINQTFHSTILVSILVVHLHSDAYLRSLTLSHKIGGEQNVLDQFFSPLFSLFSLSGRCFFLYFSCFRVAPVLHFFSFSLSILLAINSSG